MVFHCVLLFFVCYALCLILVDLALRYVQNVIQTVDAIVFGSALHRVVTCVFVLSIVLSLLDEC